MTDDRPLLHANHAGTSWPKPASVQAAVVEALAHDVSTWPASYEAGHARVARAFGIEDPARLLLTPGGTSALQVGVRDHPWQAGDRILLSAMEHHALHRPARLLEGVGVEVGIVPRAAAGPIDLGALEAALAAGRVRLVAVSAAASVTGEVLPVAEIVALAHVHGALCLVDVAQAAGWLPVDVAAWDADLLAFTGHKGLQAPWGIGGLYVHPRVMMQSPEASCDAPAPGGNEARGTAPLCSTMPGPCDVGSVDRLALAGLAAALDWLEAPAQAERLARARSILADVETALQDQPAITVHAAQPAAERLPTVAFTHAHKTPLELVAWFRARGVQIGGGLLCAPLAHGALGTEPLGVARISVGAAWGPAEAERLLAAVQALGDN